MQASKPAVFITYNSRNVTRELIPYLVDFSYTGEVNGSADTIEMTLEDAAALWRNNWYPVKGDKVQIEIGYTALMVSVGVFSVDEISIAGPPDQITIRAISAGYAKQLRTKTSFAHEKKTLAQIVNVLAAKSGFTVLGSIPDVFIKRETQYRETDINFLQRLANRYGCVFSVRDNQLIFSIADDIESATAGVVVDMTDLISYSLTDKTSESYTRVSVKRYDHRNDKTVSAAADSDADTVPETPNEAWQDPALLVSLTAADIQEQRGRYENDGQATYAARSFLRRNLEKLTGTITIEGNPLLMEGSNFELTGMGAMSGRFHVVRCEHKINTSGYITTLEIKRTGAIDKTRWAPKQVITKNFSSVK